MDTSGSSVELERTIVHETGHLIFLKPGTDDTTEYADAFNEEFPPGADYSADAFVTEYAASSPEDGGEDIAESWAMFVFGDTEFAGDADEDGDLDVVEPDTQAAQRSRSLRTTPNWSILQTKYDRTPASNQQHP